MHNIGRAFDRRWHDSSTIYYIDKESYHGLSKTHPILFIRRVSK